MKNNLTQSQSIRIGIWALVLVIASIANMLTYYNIIYVSFSMRAVIFYVIFFYIIVAIQAISLVEIYLIVSEKSRKRRSKR